MKKFGEIFKKFRESRGLRLKDVAKVGISTSQLSRFENGETDLTISKFIAVLDEVNVPIDEFMYAVHDFRRDELNELLLKVNCFEKITLFTNGVKFQAEQISSNKYYFVKNSITRFIGRALLF